MYKFLVVLSCILVASCAESDNDNPLDISENSLNDSIFNRAKWDIKENNTYVYRKYMMDDIVYNDTIRDLNKQQILNLLGEPNRVNENHIYYLIDETRLIFWPLHTTMVVFRFNDKDEVVWIKIHK
ncbi:MAG TPA: hypothetical protein VJ970_03310 [Flavobacteriaceae bacterium]|nr:hypothetical protein [Flavobacteriaceae bacterium]